MDGWIPVIGCLVLGIVLFVQRAALLRISINTSRCQQILSNDQTADPRNEFGVPSKVTLGLPVPEFELTNLQTGDVVSLNTIVGKSSILIFCSKMEYEQWDVGLLFAFLQRFWHRVDGNTYIIFIDQTSMIFADLPHAEILNTYVGKSIVFCLDSHRRIVEAMGLSQTPCILELSSGAVVKKIGFVDADS